MSHLTRRRPDRRLILLLGALAAWGPLGTDIYLPSLPSIAASFGLAAAALFGATQLALDANVMKASG